MSPSSFSPPSWARCRYTQATLALSIAATCSAVSKPSPPDSVLTSPPWMGVAMRAATRTRSAATLARTAGSASWESASTSTVANGSCSRSCCATASALHRTGHRDGLMHVEETVGHRRVRSRSLATAAGSPSTTLARRRLRRVAAPPARGRDLAGTPIRGAFGSVRGHIAVHSCGVELEVTTGRRWALCLDAPSSCASAGVGGSFVRAASHRFGCHGEETSA